MLYNQPEAVTSRGHRQALTHPSLTAFVGRYGSCEQAEACCCRCLSTTTPRTGEDDTDVDESAACHVGEETDKDVSSPHSVDTVGPIACLALLVATMFNHKRGWHTNITSTTAEQHRSSASFENETRNHETMKTPFFASQQVFFFSDMFGQSYFRRIYIF